jgi:hypothetical protein
MTTNRMRYYDSVCSVANNLLPAYLLNNVVNLLPSAFAGGGVEPGREPPVDEK